MRAIDHKDLIQFDTPVGLYRHVAGMMQNQCELAPSLKRVRVVRDDLIAAGGNRVRREAILRNFEGAWRSRCVATLGRSSVTIVDSHLCFEWSPHCRRLRHDRDDRDWPVLGAVSVWRAQYARHEHHEAE